LIPYDVVSHPKVKPKKQIVGAEFCVVGSALRTRRRRLAESANFGFE